MVIVMGEGLVREHEKIAVEVASGRRLDLERPDLGHPDDPGLWDRLHGNCAVGTLVCADCAETSSRRYLYLQEWRGLRRVCVYPLDQVIAAGLAETPEHRAFKDKICQLADHQGLTAELEVAGPRRRRQTDVVVRGGPATVGWEVQLSGLSVELLRKRIRVTTGDGLVSSWLTMRDTPGFKTLIDRAPACTTKALVALDIATAKDLRVFQGLKRLRIVPCTHQRTERWHRELTCTGHHAQPAALDAERHPSLAEMITLSAAGDVVAIEWPRKLTLGYNRPWLWVSRLDAERFYEVERPYLETHDLATTLPAVPAEPAPPGWHIAETRSDAHPTWNDTNEQKSPTGLASILGNQCPRCGWTRNQHRWDCPTGLSTLTAPTFTR
jgi:hypothetical protein